jgi:hypothetical protein
MPTLSPSGPGGRETYQDRAARCAHQAGVYGAAAGDRGTYIGTCINQSLWEKPFAVEMAPPTEMLEALKTLKR